MENNLGGDFLTEEGKEFYNCIKVALEYINNAENKFNDLIDLEAGTIKIGVATTLTKYFLTSFLEEFHDLHPKINIQIDTNITKVLLDKLNFATKQMIKIITKR